MPANDASDFPAAAMQFVRAGTSLPDELRRFEHILAEVSAGFINMPAAHVDVGITGALVNIALLLDVDRITLLRLQPDGGFVVTHSGSIDGVAAIAPNHVPLYPWSFAEVRANRHVAFTNVDELPPEAADDKARWRRISVHSNLMVPIVVGGAVEGVLAFACLRASREWPLELIGRVRVLATIVGNALAHQRTARDLAAALRFEQLMSRVLASIVTNSNPDLDEVITLSLRDAAAVLGADRATLWQRKPGEDTLRKTHRWLGEGMPTPLDIANGTRLPWLTSQLLAGRPVSGEVASLPAAAASDIPVFEALCVRALVAVPLSIGGEIAGALSFGSQSENGEFLAALAPRVQLFGEVLSTALARQRAERAERDARAEAAHAARLGTMGVVAASLAHELTQPLAAIMSNAETAVALLANSDLDRNELRSTIEDILADDRRAGKLIQQLRRFLRRDDLEHSGIDMRLLLEEVVGLVRSEAVGKGVAVTVDMPAHLPAIVGNHSQLQQVVLNLLLNAFDAVALNPPPARHVKVTAAASDEVRVVIEVADNGVGLDQAAQARAFAPFYTTKPKGMGLGLSISRSIAESHGGTLTMRSVPGSGSVFRFELPAVRDDGTKS